MNIKKLSLLGVGILLIVLGTGVAVTRVVIAQKEGPLKPCLKELTKIPDGIPESEKKHQELIHKYTRLAEYETKDSGYYIYALGQISDGDYWEPLIVVQEDICRTLNQGKPEAPFANFVAPDVASRLSALVMERKIKAAGGKEKFEKGFEALILNDGNKAAYMPRETYEALKKLGIKIPTKVRPTDTIPNPKDVVIDRK